jgi:hypothetical protein
MKLSASSKTAIESAIKEAIKNFISEDDKSFVTDIHLQPNQTLGELHIYDDDDKELSSAIIEEWVDCDSDDFNENIESILRSILNEMNENGAFNNIAILKPYSFVLVDEDKETICELLLMDDEQVLVNNELLKGLDEELDNFLKDLLEN